MNEQLAEMICLQNQADENKEAGQIVVEAANLTCKVGQTYLLKEIQWEVKKGEHWLIFGLNGSGKTTLLSILAGYKMPTAGMLRVFGENYHNDNLLDNRKRIGLVSSSYFDQYYKKESVLEIVLSGMFGTLGLDFDIKDSDVKRALQLLHHIGLGDKLHQSYVSMSKGERQNVLIARALIANPEILILDEPCSGLDIAVRDQMLHTVEHLSTQTNMTIIYVTHYAEEILPCFEHAILLRQGKIYQKGSSKELFTEACMGDFLGQNVSLTTDEQGRIQIKGLAQCKLSLV